jgi:hypothetical protein
MTRKMLKIVDGPDKPALRCALAYPGSEQVRFILEGDATDAAIARIEDMAEGFTFEINGWLTTGVHKGERFLGTYSVETRSGQIALGIGA